MPIARKQEDTLYEALEAFWAESEAIESLNKPSPLAGEGRVRGAEDVAFDLASLKIPRSKTREPKSHWGKELWRPFGRGSVSWPRNQTAAFAPFKEAIVLNLVHWVAGYLREWESQKLQGGFLDFDDLLLKTRDLLQDHPEAREEMKKRP